MWAALVLLTSYKVNAKTTCYQYTWYSNVCKETLNFRPSLHKNGNSDLIFFLLTSYKVRIYSLLSHNIKIWQSHVIMVIWPCVTLGLLTTINWLSASRELEEWMPCNACNVWILHTISFNTITCSMNKDDSVETLEFCRIEHKIDYSNN